ncbi:MAG TPA: hormogonium polysaccharide biosynthesis protein HpsA, partial [Chroococcidiopsis sp.]
VGSIGYRTYSRAQQTIGERQQRVIYNAATPAIDRAKAKLEFLFDRQRDFRLPAGVPGETQLLGMMLNDEQVIMPDNITVSPRVLVGGQDAYTFPGETRLDLNGDNRSDNAWSYQQDVNGDGQLDRVVYSILFRTPPIVTSGNNPLAQADQASVATRAQSLQVRHGPLSNSNQQNPACTLPAASSAPDRGWIPDATSPNTLRKNFQVDVFVQPTGSSTTSSLEFHQDREVDRGIRWGAWFRNDLEVFPGPRFNWNGAMHTEGNLLVGGSSFYGYLISSPNSCFYTPENSEITVRQFEEDPLVGRPAFQGQFMVGTLRDNDYTGTARFDLLINQGAAPQAAVAMTNTSDSIQNTNLPIRYALDPVVLQTQDFSEGRELADPGVNRDTTAWNPSTSLFLKRKRMRQETKATTPYVDDFFRADNRYGPKPRYNDDDTLAVPGFIGSQIPNTLTELVRDTPPVGSSGSEVGLDGYWERRARNEGLRLVVGQRLELGDAMGWGGYQDNAFGGIAANEPLRPWASCPSNGSGRCQEARQRRSLWDNLPAVQATAIYHNASGAVDTPVACIISAVHPGTPGTLTNSATFQNLLTGIPAAAFGTSGYGTTVPVVSDVFRGVGTNGWQYSVPADTQFVLGTPLMTALRNVATYAGDPNGGAPSFTPVQDDVVHPYPSMAMWGDFSMLRKVLDLVQSGTSFSNLSPADKTTLQTAACSLGMLAHNIDYLEKFNIDDPSLATALGTPDLPASNASYNNGLRGFIRRLRANDALSPAIPASIKAALTANPLTPYDYKQPEVYVDLLERWYNDPSTTGTLKAQLQQSLVLARLIVSKEQVARDRSWGFQEVSGVRRFGVAPLGHCDLWARQNRYINSSGTAVADATVSGGDGDPLKYLCSYRARYPILYSLFPARDANPPYATPTGVIGTAPASAADFNPQGINYANFEPQSELNLWTRDADDTTNLSYITSVNSGLLYQPVRPDQIALTPRKLDFTDWTLPQQTTATGTTPNSTQDTLIKVCATAICLPGESGQLVRVAFKDTAPFNGREMLVTRMLDLNIGFMRTVSTPFGSDTWLPKRGIIYAFREDAVSERAIVRPKGAAPAFSSCFANGNPATACQMKAGTLGAFASTDPPLSDTNGITPKPVDYIPDPDRRPHGFRIKNGAIVSRANDEGRGISLISDNALYVQGDFNLHQNTAGSSRIEEFTDLLLDDFTNFYSRSNLNNNFARANTDQWRPSELLADAISIISNTFCDGSIQDSFLTASVSAATLSSTQIQQLYGCTNAHNLTSYLNQDRPSTNPAASAAANNLGNRWLRANLVDSFYAANLDTTVSELGQASPIVIDRQGNPMRVTSSTSGGSTTSRVVDLLTTTTAVGIAPYTGGYFTMADNKALMPVANAMRVNSIIISGLVPSRVNQSYGGLHNFPRFLEDWNSSLYIAGAFLQLNFSNQATGPFDQDSWEQGSLPATSESIRYYGPPDRRWGYDVGIQYAPASPIAQRFTPQNTSRSEFYSEPPANDPYIRNLCLQVSSNCPQ